jgi:hypothetical protein
MDTLLKLTEKQLKNSTISLEFINALEAPKLKELREKVNQYRQRYHINYHGSTYNSHSLYKLIKNKLTQLIIHQGDTDETLQLSLRTLQAAEETNPIRRKVNNIINEKYSMSHQTFLKSLREAIGLEYTPPLFKSKPQIYSDDSSIEMAWDLDTVYKLKLSPLIRLKPTQVIAKSPEYQAELERAAIEEHDLSACYEMWFSDDDDPEIYESHFIINNYLIKLKYKDYGGGYSHGDDLYITFEFDIPRSLQALTFDLIRNYPENDGFIDCLSYNLRALDLS